MTDKEIIDGLIARDNQITSYFFYTRCRPLFMSIMRLVFNYPVEYDEMVGEFYAYLMADDCAKLRQFHYRSSLYQWLKVVATRFFIRFRNLMIENVSKESLSSVEPEVLKDSSASICDKIDIEHLLRLIDNQRYADVIRHLIIEDMEPAKYSAQIGVTVDNLYNIKKRAMAALTSVALRYYNYGK